MAIKINIKVAKTIIKGSSIFSTGGGFEYSDQISMLSKIFKGRSEIRIVSIDELLPKSYVCTVYAVGSAGNSKEDLSNQIKIGLKEVGKLTKKRPSAIFAGEANIDAVVFQAAKFSKLPVLDADCTGGRAVPEIKQDNLAVLGKSICPLVAVTPKKEVITLNNSRDINFIESFVRNLSFFSPGSVIVVDHVMKVKEAKKTLTLGIFKRSLEIGRVLESNLSSAKKISDICKRVEAKVLFEGWVEKLELSDSEGFLVGYCWIKDVDGNSCKIYIKNESLICWINNKTVLTVPDLICLFDKEKELGIHNNEISTGQKVIVLGIKASKLWRSEKAKEIFGPRNFGFNFSPVLI